jgi:hypothetical protein
MLPATETPVVYIKDLISETLNLNLFKHTGSKCKTKSCKSLFGLKPFKELINLSSAFKKCGWDMKLDEPKKKRREEKIIIHYSQENKLYPPP